MTTQTPIPIHRSSRARRSARRRSLPWLLATTVSLSVAATACGSDDDHGDHDGAAAPAGSDAPATPGTVDDHGGPAVDGPPVDLPSVDTLTGEDLTATCAQYEQISSALSGALAPDETASVLEAFAAEPPTRLTDAAPVIADGITALFEGDEAILSDSGFVSSLGMAGSYLFDTCALDTRMDVTGADYSFDGVPEEVSAGKVGVRLVNMSPSSEPHELIIVRRPDGDTRTTEEVAALDPDQLFSEYEMVAVAWADVPAATMSIITELSPGSYLAVCTLPVGEHADMTHLHAGMVEAFEAV